MTITAHEKNYNSSIIILTMSFCQDDVVMGTLSVRENLQFSAALRLPSHMSSSQRRERVERVIQELGLSKCADTKVPDRVLYTVYDDILLYVYVMSSNENTTYTACFFT